MPSYGLHLAHRHFIWSTPTEKLGEVTRKSLDFPHPPGQQQSMGMKESFPPSKGPHSPLLRSPCRHLIYTDHLTWASVALVSYPPDPVRIWLCKLEDTLFTVTSALTKGWPNQQHSQLFQFGWALGSILKRGLLWALLVTGRGRTKELGLKNTFRSKMTREFDKNKCTQVKVGEEKKDPS